MDKLFIKALRLEAIIGIHADERKLKQPIALDVELTLQTQAAIASDQINQTVDYESLAGKIAQWVAATDFQLVESLADFLARKLLAEFPLQAVSLRLSKFTEKVAADAVGVCIKRTLAGS